MPISNHFFKTIQRLSKLIDLSFKYLVNIIQSSQTPPTEERKEKNILPGPHLSIKFVCFVALRPKSTAMVIAGRSVHLTTLFPGQA